MQKIPVIIAVAAAGLGAMLQAQPATAQTAPARQNLNDIQTVVVIYAENRSFDNLYGAYPGANGMKNAPKGAAIQVDRDGKPMKGLPAVWTGTSGGVVTGAPLAPTGVTQAQSAAFLGQFNHPYSVDMLYKGIAPTDGDALSYTNRDLYHRFYENQMQIDHGKNDMFAAWADSGGMTMGYFPATSADLPLWGYAHKYVLADNFFQAAFGGSFLNHQFLICSCAPYYGHDGVNPNAGSTPPEKANPTVAQVEGGTLGSWLKVSDKSPKSAIDGPPVFTLSGNLTPDFYGVNTMQPPYIPSGNATSDKDGNQLSVKMDQPSTMLPQTQPTIGSLLTAANVDWAWYAGAWGYALSHPATTVGAIPDFQYHHQPFNYYAAYAPGTAARTQHLKDGGMDGSLFVADIDAGKLPPVSFYKPQGNINEHAGYANVTDGDNHIVMLLKHLEASPQWPHMLVIVTYDEFGGWWDHVAPPKADRWGPGTRIPALIVSPYAKKGVVDHTQYDTTSIIRFITRRWKLPVLDGIKVRDAALKANHEPPLGDLTQALRLN